MRQPLISLVMMGALITPVFADSSASVSASSNSKAYLYDKRDIARRTPIIPEAAAVAIAVKRVPGTVLAAAVETNDGIRTWQVDIKGELGRMTRLWLNASSGEVLKTEVR